MKKENKNNGIKDIGKEYFKIISNRNIAFWKEYTYDAKQIASSNKIGTIMKGLKNPIKIQIPSKDNIRYKHIETFEDHYLSNNLALDMIIRNKEFQNYIYFTEIIDFEFENRPIELKENHYKKLQRELIERFGFNIKDTKVKVLIITAIRTAILNMVLECYNIQIKRKEKILIKL